MNIRDIETLSKTIGPIVKNAIEASSAALKKEFNTEIGILKSEISNLKNENDELKKTTISTIELKIDTQEVKEMLDGVTKQVEELIGGIPEIPELDTASILASLEETISAKFRHFEESLELPSLPDYQPAIDAAISEMKNKTEETVEQVNLAMEAINAIPIPKDGTSVTVEDLQPLLSEIEQKAMGYVKSIELPKNGTSVTMEDVAPLLVAAAEEAKNLAMEYVKSIELPKDGKSVSLEEVTPVLEAGLKKIEESAMEFVEAIELPQKGQDGTSVTIEDVTPILEKAISEIESKAMEYVKSIELPKDGADGREGTQGQDGKDALALEILPTIDLERSYPRGTYAKFQNGLWRSFETTFELRGWECIVAGINDVKINQIGEKNFELVISNSTGSEFTKEINLPVMIYKNVYKDTETYAAGNVVTFAGSAWHSNIDENKSKPGTNADWSLCVKKGRDYKEPVQTLNPSKQVQI